MGFGDSFGGFFVSFGGMCVLGEDRGLVWEFECV